MFEKVNPSHPDKIADRIAGAIVDKAYTLEERPKIAVEVLIGHNFCTIIAETSVSIPLIAISEIVYRISKESPEKLVIKYIEVPQDAHLAQNQKNGIRCGDNGIFKGVPVTGENIILQMIAQEIYSNFPSDGKYIINDNPNSLIICQSNATNEDIQKVLSSGFPATHYTCTINPLGEWTGGTNTDAGATNRKLGSDMGDSITGGGINGKDCSKADVSVNIYAWLKAQIIGKPVEMYCAIGDTEVCGIPYEKIVKIAEEYIKYLGGFEKLAEWGFTNFIPENIQEMVKETF